MTTYLSVQCTNIARNFSAFQAASFLSMALFLCFQGALAQSFKDVKWGPVLADQKGNDILHTFIISNKDFIVIRDNKRKREGLIIERVDGDSLNVIVSKALVFPKLEKSIAQYLQPLTIGKKTYIIATADDPEGLNVFIMAFELLENLDLSKIPIILGSASRTAVLYKNGFILRSDSLNALTCLLMPIEFQEGKNEKFEIRLFDSNLQLINEKKLEVPHSSEDVLYSNVVVDSLNALFVLVSLADLTVDTKGGRRNIGRSYSLLKYDWNSQELSEKSLSLGTKWLYDAKMFRDQSGRLKIAGYYSNMIDLSMAGTFSLELSRFTSEVLNQGISPFDRNFRSAIRPQNGSLSEADLSMFYIDKVFEQRNGNVMVMSEKTYTTTSTIFNPATGTYNVVNIFNFDEIVITSMTGQSKILLAIMIPKFQSSTRGIGEYTSYCTFRKGQKTYVVYNDHDRNVDLSLSDSKGIRQLTSIANALPVVVSIDDEGRLKKEAILRQGTSQVVVDSRFLIDLPDGVVLTTLSGSRTQYLKLQFE